MRCPGAECTCGSGSLRELIHAHWRYRRLGKASHSTLDRTGLPIRTQPPTTSGFALPSPQKMKYGKGSKNWRTCSVRRGPCPDLRQVLPHTPRRLPPDGPRCLSSHQRRCPRKVRVGPRRCWPRPFTSCRDAGCGIHETARVLSCTRTSRSGRIRVATAWSARTAKDRCSGRNSAVPLRGRRPEKRFLRLRNLGVQSKADTFGVTVTETNALAGRAVAGELGPFQALGVMRYFDSFAF